jgi:hypothetical protein
MKVKWNIRDRSFDLGEVIGRLPIQVSDKARGLIVDSCHASPQANARTKTLARAPGCRHSVRAVVMNNKVVIE